MFFNYFLFKFENIIVANESKNAPEEHSLKSEYSNFNRLVAIMAIIMNLIFYYYVYTHLSMKISNNFESLKTESIELEESFSYRSIIDI